MTVSKKRVIGVAIIALYVVGASLMGTREAVAEKPTPVEVTNTVPVTQSGAWNVGISGTPTVNVNNSAAAPMMVRDVDGPNRQPFQRIFNAASGPGACGLNFCTFPLGAVPAGKFLVLTHFQGELALATGNVPLGVTLKRSTGSVRLFDVPRNSLACYNDTLSIGSPTRCPFNEEIRVILTAGESAFVDLYLSAGGNLDQNGWPQSVVVTGYFVDAPPSNTPLMQQLMEPTDALQSSGSSQTRTVMLP